MSARSAIFQYLTNDTGLAALGIDADSVWPTQAMDTAPRDRRFLILRWEETTPAANLASQTTELTIWAHCPREMNTDYDPLDLILDRCAEMLRYMVDYGEITAVRYNGKSPDLNDEGYKTITRNAAFTIVSR